MAKTNELATLLFEKRTKKFLTQEEMAKAIGISRPNYINLENGTSKTISLYTLRKIAKYFGNTEAYVMHKYMQKK